MHDIRAIRDDPEAFDAGLRRRRLTAVEAIINDDAKLKGASQSCKRSRRDGTKSRS